MTNSGLIDILESLDWITKSIADRSEAEFVGDETLCFAVAQRLTVVGEAVARLTPELKAKYAAIPWTDSWQTSADHVPILLTKVSEILKSESPYEAFGFEICKGTTF